MSTASRSLALALLLTAPLAAQTPARRPIEVGDLYRVKDVRDPQRSPDGRWVAYTVTSVDSARDRSVTHIWMASWDGSRNIALTSDDESERAPRWSPDGRYLSFLSARRDPGGHTQLWLLDRRGGDAVRVTDVRGGISEYAWSPDARRLVFVIEDPDPDEPPPGADSSRKPVPRPIVIDRYHFKNDGDGYLGTRRSHLYLFDLASRKLDLLTPGRFDEEQPSWSPDGASIAFVSKRHPADPDRADNTDLWVVEARPGATPRQLTSFIGRDEGPPAWSPDGRSIAYLQGGDPRYSAYNAYTIAVIPAAGCLSIRCVPRVLTGALDRTVRSPVWSVDGSSIVFLVVDDRSEYVARVPAAGGAIRRLTAPGRVVSDLSAGPDGELAVLAATDSELPEVYALDRGALRRLTHQNDAWLSSVQLASTEDISATSKDGTIVHGLLVKPATFSPGRKYPLLLRIHGGPNGQDAHEFNFERQLFAADGYVVVTANYRGSTGRGEAYSHAIFADWGHKEVIDLLGMMDHVETLPFVDRNRLGIGGWSYGAILTDYTIATDHRFRAAIAGAGSALQLSMYGVDEYITQYETELGPPWRHEAAWLKVSYPFFHADRISTPTLFLGGTKDFNVPLVGGEQMYQALRSLGVPTQLIIYPDQHHGISRPSFRRDRLERYLAWYDRYVKGAAQPATASGGSME